MYGSEWSSPSRSQAPSKTPPFVSIRKTDVAPAATKTQIKEAVQKIFKVKVAGVRTAICHGKFRRRGRAEGHRRDWKKAYVKLAAGRDHRTCELRRSLTSPAPGLVPLR